MTSFHQCLLIAALGAAPLACAAALAHEWPHLKGEASEACQEALAMGRQAFRSTEPMLYAPMPSQPGPLRSVRVLGVDGLDLSGGDAITADPREFEKVPRLESSNRRLYWQRAPASGGRIVIVEHPLGAQGDAYGVYLIAPGMTRETFLQELDRPGRDQHPVPRTLIERTWRPPSIFRTASGRFWLVHAGEPYDFMAPWPVHELSERDARWSCTIEFRPEVQAAIRLLPLEVQTLGKLLDRTLGSDERDGTSHPIRQLRLEAAKVWATLALRPWVSLTPYNTRNEVDAALSAQAAVSPVRRRQLAAIRAQEKEARKAMAQYYARNFGRPDADAQAAAAYAVDVAIRSHYTFAKERLGTNLPETSVPNPWVAPAQER